MLTHKKVTKSGGITIPRAVRQGAGILPGTAVDIITDEAGIHITKHVPTCFHCGSVDDVISRFEIEICKSCAEALLEGFTDGTDE